MPVVAVNTEAVLGEGLGVTDRLCTRRVQALRSTVTMIFPICALDSTNRCASTAGEQCVE
jgi:hypothetical protein